MKKISMFNFLRQIGNEKFLQNISDFHPFAFVMYRTSLGNGMGQSVQNSALVY